MQVLASCVLVGLGIFGVVTTSLEAQTITFTTLAGSVGGTNDGADSSAQFYFPSGIAVDAAGSLFVSDTSNNTIRKVTPVGADWIVSTIAGTPAYGGVGGTNDGLGGQAQFWRPNGVTVDAQGIVYVVDHYTHTIRKLTPIGTNWLVTTIAGLGQSRGYADGTNSDARFWSPTGITVDQAGNLYVADTFTYTIRKLSPVGTNWIVTTIAGSAFNFGFVNGTNISAQFNLPFGIAVDRSNNLFVADYGNNAIRKIAPFGTNWVVSTVAGSGAVGSANGTNTNAKFNSPADVAIDPTGSLYVSDQYNHTIRKITPYGTNWVVSTVAGLALQSGSSNGIGPSARFNKPWGIAVDANGRLFVSDYANQTIREGIPSSSAPPALRISLSATDPVLSWPLSAADFVLETASALSAAPSWTPITNGIVISGNNFILTNHPSSSPTFYRLRGH